MAGNNVLVPLLLQLQLLFVRGLPVSFPAGLIDRVSKFDFAGFIDELNVELLGGNATPCKAEIGGGKNRVIRPLRIARLGGGAGNDIVDAGDGPQKLAVVIVTAKMNFAKHG